jgi:hypothetical protein
MAGYPTSPVGDSNIKASTTSMRLYLWLNGARQLKRCARNVEPVLLRAYPSAEHLLDCAIRASAADVGFWTFASCDIEAEAITVSFDCNGSLP